MTTPRDPTQFTRESAERIARVVRAAELATPAGSPLNWEPVLDPRKIKLFRVAAYQGPWPIGTDKVVTFYNEPTGTANVTNLFFPLTSPNPAGRFCGVAKERTSWFLIDVPFETATAAFAGATANRSFFGTGATSTITFFGSASTQQISFHGGGSTQTITYSSPGSAQTIEVVTAVAASLNTANCSITVTPTKQNITYCSCGSSQSSTIITGGSTQTAIAVRMSMTQTALVVTMSATQQIQIMTNVFTSTFLRFPE